MDGSVLDDLAPTGRVRAAINFGNPVLAQKDATTGEARGVSVDLARELARRLEVPLELITFDTAGTAVAALGAGSCDIGFLAIDPVRAAEIAFTAAYVIIEATYMVAGNSALQAIEEVDREGIRVAAGRNTAYDLYLTRALRHATLVRAPTSAAAIEVFVDGGLDAVAGVRQPLVQYAASHAGLRVMAGRFLAIEQAMATPKGRQAGARHLVAYIEEMKASGFIADALRRSNQGEATVAPPSSK